MPLERRDPFCLARAECAPLEGMLHLSTRGTTKQRCSASEDARVGSCLYTLSKAIDVRSNVMPDRMIR